MYVEQRATANVKTQIPYLFMYLVIYTLLCEYYLRMAIYFKYTTRWNMLNENNATSAHPKRTHFKRTHFLNSVATWIVNAHPIQSASFTRIMKEETEEKNSNTIYTDCTQINFYAIVQSTCIVFIVHTMKRWNGKKENETKGCFAKFLFLVSWRSQSAPV